MRIPSVKKLEEAFPGKGKQLRQALQDEIYAWPTNPKPLTACNDIIGGHGIEYIQAGHNLKSPAIAYVNMGDTYDTTLMKIRGNIVIGNWGTWVEMGNYD